MTLASEGVAIARTGIRAVDAEAATARCLRGRSLALRVGRGVLRPLPGGRIHLVALGKAAGRMAAAAVRRLGPSTPGVVVTSAGSPKGPGRLRTLVGDHPLPGVHSLAAGRALARYVESLSPQDAVLFLISGGGSALAEWPVPGVTLSDLRRTTRLLLASGAPIEVDNALRVHLSRLKGGGLAGLVPSGRYATVAISDVVGDPPSVVASGPTVPARVPQSMALRAARRYGLLDRLPPRVRAALRRPAPTLRPPRRAPFVFAATNATAVEGAARAARRRGFRVVVAARPVVGETAPAALQQARELARRADARPALSVAVISGGETTVTLGSRPGRGGRNQEFVLAAIPLLAGRDAALVSLGTDGIDGPTDAAGGWADGRLAERAARQGIDLARALAHHDAYPALERLGVLVRTGPTGTNVTDLHVGLVAGRDRRRPVSRDTGTRRPAPGARASRRRSS